MCPPGTVFVYDSLPSTDLHSWTNVQIVAVLCSPEREINVGFPLVQIQHAYGGNYSGLFALAFATSLCDGENPAEINYIQNKHREDFLKCLERRTISKFPQRERKKAAIGSIVKLIIYIAYIAYVDCQSLGTLSAVIPANNGIMKNV